jgi:hypothetical protein
MWESISAAILAAAIALGPSANARILTGSKTQEGLRLGLTAGLYLFDAQDNATSLRGPGSYAVGRFVDTAVPVSLLVPSPG